MRFFTARARKALLVTEDADFDPDEELERLALFTEAGELVSLDGVPGPAGPTGATGAVGATGTTGAKGNKGDPGPRGYTGPPGPQGLIGPRGPRGLMGEFADIPVGNNGTFLKRDSEADGGVIWAQINAALTYLGTWNAETNTPEIADGENNEGDWYLVSTGGTQDLGGGTQAFDIGDYVRYTDGLWTKLNGLDRPNFGTIFSGKHAGTLSSAIFIQNARREKIIEIPSDCDLTGIGVANGNVVNGNLKVYAASVEDGTVIASSVSTPQGTAGIAQKIPFTALLEGVPAGRLVIGVISDSATAQVYMTTMGIEPYAVTANGSFVLPASVLVPSNVAITASPIIWTY